jgi:hypothetical protein
VTAKKTPKTPEKKPKTPAKPRKPREAPEIVTNYQALQKTIAELRAAGQLTDLDQARIQIALGLAAAVDAMPDNPSMWREYRAAEKALREEASAHGDPFDQLLASLTAEVRDQEKQTKQNPRTRS